MIVNFFKQIGPDAWIQTFGGIIGALLAAIIAVFLYKFQVRYDRRKEQIKEIKNFLKSSYVINRFVDSGFSSVQSIGIMKNSENHELEEKVIYIKQQSEALRFCLSKISLINDDYIPEPIYETFLTIKSLLELCETQSNLLIYSFTGKDVPDAFTDFEQLESSLFLLKQEFYDYGEQVKIQLKKLT